MISAINVINEEGQEVKIEIIMRFKVEELGKEYIVYTVDDDGVSETVPICIAGINDEGGKLSLRLIDESEKNMVLVFYDNLRDMICGNRNE